MTTEATLANDAIALHYRDAAKALNDAAYALFRASQDTTALPHIDRQAIRYMIRESDRLVDQGLWSGMKRGAA